jgi:hypothetical protein
MRWKLIILGCLHFVHINLSFNFSVHWYAISSSAHRTFFSSGSVEEFHMHCSVEILTEIILVIIVAINTYLLRLNE